MSAIAAGIIGGGAVLGSIGGAIIGSNAASGAAKTQADATKYAADLQKQEFDIQQAQQAPYRQAGVTALSGLSSMASTPLSFTKEDFYNNMDPAYQFDLEQGQQAIQRSAAARGTLMSGGTLKDLTSYSQGQASNEFQNAYNRYMNNQTTNFNRLSAIASLGEGANAASAQLASNYGNNMSNLAVGNANANAASQIAQGNLWGGALSNLGNTAGGTYLGYTMLNRGYPQAPGYGAPSSIPMSSPTASLPIA